METQDVNLFLRLPLSAEDHNKLLEHSAKQEAFTQAQRAQMTEKVQTYCADFNRGIGELNVAEFAKLLSGLANEADKKADKHYESVLKTLSPEGKAFIGGEVIPGELSRTIHSKVDVVAVAEQSPQLLRGTFEETCIASHNLDTKRQIVTTTIKNKDGIGAIITTTEFGKNQKKDAKK